METKIALIVVEWRDMIPLDYAKILTALAWNKTVDIKFYGGPRKAIWWVRREMIELTLRNPEYTHILFLDTDVIPENPNFLQKLLSHDAPLVSGYYNNVDGRPINRKDGKPYMGKGLEEVDLFSMGLSLIKREVLEKVSYPEPNPLNKLDADFEFCAQCKDTGYKILCDFDVRGYHLLTVPC